MRTNLSIKEELRDRYKNYSEAKQVLENRVLELRQMIQEDLIVDRGTLALSRDSLTLNEGMLRIIKMRLQKVKEELGED